jgi:uncharacterized protein YciW
LPGDGGGAPGGGEYGTGYWYVNVFTMITVDTPTATACIPSAVTVAQLVCNHWSARSATPGGSALEAISTSTTQRHVYENKDHATNTR